MTGNGVEYGKHTCKTSKRPWVWNVFYLRVEFNLGVGRMPKHSRVATLVTLNSLFKVYTGILWG